MSEAQESIVLTTEQQQRTHAVMTAAQVLRDRTQGGPIGGTKAAGFPDIVELADYITTGDVYMVNLVRREKAEAPLMGVFGLSGDIFTDLLSKIAADSEPMDRDGDAKSDGSADYETPAFDDFDPPGPGRRPIKDNPQA